MRLILLGSDLASKHKQNGWTNERSSKLKIITLKAFSNMDSKVEFIEVKPKYSDLPFQGVLKLK